MSGWRSTRSCFPVEARYLCPGGICGIGSGQDLPGLLSFCSFTAAALVLFLHGGGANARAWDVAALLLGDAGRRVALDLRGHGDSDWWPPDDYGVIACAGDIAAAVKAFGEPPTIVVGHSYGGVAALEYASSAANSPFLAGLVLIDVGPRIEAWGHLVQRALSSPGAPPFTTLAEAAAVVGESEPGRSARRALAAFHNIVERDGRLDWKFDPRQFSQEVGDVSETERLWPTARALCCPALIVRGSRSRILSQNMGEELAHAMPAARLCVIEGAGHNVHLDEPGALAREIVRFVNSLAV